MADRIVLCVGTKRGLFLFESNRRRQNWKLRGPFLQGWNIYHAVIDTRGAPRLHVASSSDVFACTTFGGSIRSSKFNGARRPPVPPPVLPQQRKWHREWGISSVPRVWHIEPGHRKEKGVLFAGTAPAALFRSEDHGRTWDPVQGLLRHPSRRKWQPGAGGLCLNSIQVDPDEPKRMYIGISSAGSFRTDNGGRTWQGINRGIASLDAITVKDPDGGT